MCGLPQGARTTTTCQSGGWQRLREWWFGRRLQIMAPNPGHWAAWRRVPHSRNWKGAEKGEGGDDLAMQGIQHPSCWEMFWSLGCYVGGGDSMLLEMIGWLPYCSGWKVRGLFVQSSGLPAVDIPNWDELQQGKPLKKQGGRSVCQLPDLGRRKYFVKFEKLSGEGPDAGRSQQVGRMVGSTWAQVQKPKP